MSRTNFLDAMAEAKLIHEERLEIADMLQWLLDTYGDDLQKLKKATEALVDLLKMTDWDPKDLTAFIH